ncbi:MAG: hypothetical protein P8Y76_13520, partial [bacterium]
MQNTTRRAAWTAAISVAVPTMATADHSWSTYHWARTANPFTLKVTDSVTSEWQYALEESLARWSQSTVLENSIAGTDEGARTRKRCSAISGQLRVCTDAYGQQGWLGR